MKRILTLLLAVATLMALAVSCKSESEPKPKPKPVPEKPVKGDFWLLYQPHGAEPVEVLADKTIKMSESQLNAYPNGGDTYVKVEHCLHMRVKKDGKYHVTWKAEKEVMLWDCFSTGQCLPGSMKSEVDMLEQTFTTDVDGYVNKMDFHYELLKADLANYKNKFTITVKSVETGKSITVIQTVDGLDISKMPTE